MSESMLEQEISVYSEKYDIHGVIRDYGVVVKLLFSYRGKELSMGICRHLYGRKNFEEIGKELIESYVAFLAIHDDQQKIKLHYWYIDERDYGGKSYTIGHGVVTGHYRLTDSTDMHTSEVRAIYVDEEEKELILTTRNSVYHCPLAYCRFNKQDAFPDIIPGYEELKKKYQDSIEWPSIEAGNVLLVLADFCEYYFHSVYYVPEEAEEKIPLKYEGFAHVGSFQDSYLINIPEARMDLRYFPHYQNIEFYDMDTQGRPLYIENVGDSVLYVVTFVGTIRLAPGDRKLVSEENVEKETPMLPDGDLYPAGIIE